MIEDLMLIFDSNVRRINQLLLLYDELATGRGRKSTYHLEILRASVVFLHSTLEDYLRSVLRWKLPSSGASRLNEIPLAGSDDKNRTKFSLGELLAYRNLMVSEVVELSVDEHLNRGSFNNTRDLANFLRDVEIVFDEKRKNHLFTRLDAMMKRRHHIVHQADRSDTIGYGRHRYKSLSVKQVRDWKLAVDGFITETNRIFLNRND